MSTKDGGHCDCHELKEMNDDPDESKFWKSNFKFFLKADQTAPSIKDKTGFHSN